MEKKDRELTTIAEAWIVFAVSSLVAVAGALAVVGTFSIDGPFTRVAIWSAVIVFALSVGVLAASFGPIRKALISLVGWILDLFSLFRWS